VKESFFLPIARFFVLLIGVPVTLERLTAHERATGLPPNAPFLVIFLAFRLLLETHNNGFGTRRVG